MNPLLGWVYWRDASGQAPAWRFGTITARGGGPLQFEPKQRTDSIRDSWIVPGLVDVHNHLSIGAHGPEEDLAASANALTELQSGVLALREMGSPVPARDLESQGNPLPKMVGAGRHIARRKRYLPGLAIELDEPGQLPEVVAEQARTGSGWVKLVGDWIDRSGGADSDLQPLWDLSVLRDAVSAAHENGARVAVHTFGSKAIEDMLEANVDSIEHGSGMSKDECLEAARRGIPVTPTLGQLELFPEFAAAAHRYPVYAKTMDDLYANRHEWWQNLVDSGVQLLPGTDAGGYQPHGQLAKELYRWREYGLDESAILDFATWRARDFLGFSALEPGAPADLVVYDENPASDLSTLQRPVRVVLDGNEL